MFSLKPFGQVDCWEIGVEPKVEASAKVKGSIPCTFKSSWFLMVLLWQAADG